MRIGTTLSYAGGFTEVVDELAELEKIGLDIAFVAEAYSYDAASQLGYLAAKTSTVKLASGIFQLYTRTPTLLAMTAANLDYVSGGRFVLGIGASGPQVIEGFHGVKYDAPLGRTRETVEICRKVWRRERLEFEGKYFTVPLPEQGTGLGKALKLINHPVRDRIPVLIAALGPKNVALTAEIAEGWQPIFFLPEKANDVWGAALAEVRPSATRHWATSRSTQGPHWRSATTSRHCTDSSSRASRCTSAVWAPRARTSTTTWPLPTGSARKRTPSRSCTCPARRPRLPMRYPTSW